MDCGWVLKAIGEGLLQVSMFVQDHQRERTNVKAPVCQQCSANGSCTYKTVRAQNQASSGSARVWPALGPVGAHGNPGEGGGVQSRSSVLLAASTPSQPYPAGTPGRVRGSSRLRGEATGPVSWGASWVSCGPASLKPPCGKWGRQALPPTGPAVQGRAGSSFCPAHPTPPHPTPPSLC